MLCTVQCRPASACARKSPPRGCTLKKQDKTRPQHHIPKRNRTTSIKAFFFLSLFLIVFLLFITHQSQCLYPKSVSMSNCLCLLIYLSISFDVLLISSSTHVYTSIFFIFLAFIGLTTHSFARFSPFLLSSLFALTLHILSFLSSSFFFVHYSHVYTLCTRASSSSSFIPYFSFPPPF